MLADNLLIKEIPEERWEAQDDLCDCTFQRIYWATNPYLGRTLEVRLCCAWAKLAELFPELKEFMREIPAFDNYADHLWETEPRPWSSTEANMPRAIWYRHLSAKLGVPLEDIRRQYDHLRPPAARAAPYVIGGPKPG